MISFLGYSNWSCLRVQRELPPFGELDLDVWHFVKLAIAQLQQMDPGFHATRSNASLFRLFSVQQEWAPDSTRGECGHVVDRASHSAAYECSSVHDLEGKLVGLSRFAVVFLFMPPSTSPSFYHNSFDFIQSSIIRHRDERQRIEGFMDNSTAVEVEGSFGPCLTIVMPWIYRGLFAISRTVGPYSFKSSLEEVTRNTYIYIYVRLPRRRSAAICDDEGVYRASRVSVFNGGNMLTPSRQPEAFRRSRARRLQTTTSEAVEAHEVRVFVRACKSLSRNGNVRVHAPFSCSWHFATGNYTIIQGSLV